MWSWTSDSEKWKISCVTLFLLYFGLTDVRFLDFGFVKGFVNLGYWWTNLANWIVGLKLDWYEVNWKPLFYFC